jgi:hypothetical protein
MSSYHAIPLGSEVGIHLQLSDQLTWRHKFGTLHQATYFMNSVGYTHDDITVYNEGSPAVSLHKFCRQHEVKLPPEAKPHMLNLYDVGHGLRVHGSKYRADFRFCLSIGEDEILLNSAQWSNLMLLLRKLDAELDKMKAGEDIQSINELGDSLFISLSSPERIFHIQRKDEQGEMQGILPLYEPDWRDLIHLKNHLSRARREQRSALQSAASADAHC